MSSLHEARARISSVEHTPANYQFGLSASYADLPNSRWGYKLFKSSKERDANFDMQMRAYVHGLAPEIKDKFEDRIGNEIVYGFLTEAVEMTEQERYYGKKYVVVFISKDYNAWFSEYRTLIHDLNLKLLRAGLTSKDNYNWANVGMLRGCLVCIDFSVEKFI